MSTQSEIVKARLNFVRKELDEAIEHLTDDMLDWAPLAGMRTVGGQLIEIGITEIQYVEQLQNQIDLPEATAKEQFGDKTTLEGLKKGLADARAKTIEYIDSLSEDQLLEEVDPQDPWYGGMDLPKVSRALLLGNIAQHEYYHTGQLVSYLWARGDNPYKW